MPEECEKLCIECIPPRIKGKVKQKSILPVYLEHIDETLYSTVMFQIKNR